MKKKAVDLTRGAREAEIAVMPPGEDDRPSDPGAFESFGDEVTVRDFKVDPEDITLDETQEAIARARQMTAEDPEADDQSRVVARPLAPRPGDDLAALDAFSVEVEWEGAGWEEAEEEATLTLSSHKLNKLRAAAASDDSEVFDGPKRARPAPVDPASLPLPPVLDPDSSE